MLSVIVSKCKRIHTSFLQLLAWANRLIPGSYTFFRAKVKGLFKDFPGGPCFHTFRKHFENFTLFVPEHLFSLAFIYFKTYKS